MIVDAFIIALRTYKEPLYTKDKIAERFPFTLANCCRTMKVTNIFGKPQGFSVSRVSHKKIKSTKQQ